MSTADIDFVRRVAAAAGYFSVVATARADGSVHASVVKAGVLDDPITKEPSVGIVLVGSARKRDLLRRSGRAVAVFQNAGQWVAVEGATRLFGPDDPCQGLTAADLRVLLRDIFVAAGGTHDNWAEYDRVMAEDRRTAVFITPERITAPG